MLFRSEHSRCCWLEGAKPNIVVTKIDVSRRIFTYNGGLPSGAEVEPMSCLIIHEWFGHVDSDLLVGRIFISNVAVRRASARVKILVVTSILVTTMLGFAP